MKRLSISTLPHWHISTLFLGTLFIGALFFSCAGDDSQVEQPGSPTTGRTIRKELSLQTIPLEVSEEEGTTRATTQVPLSENEKKIYRLTVLQFGGTADASTLIKKDAVTVSEINTTTGAFYFDFEEPAGGGESKVYLVANIADADLPATTTLGAFEGGIIDVSCKSVSDMQSDGLPMIASQSFNVSAANPAPFKLKSLLAKVVFSFDTTTDFKPGPFRLWLMDANRSVPIKEGVPGDSPWRPSGLSGGGTEYYPNEDPDYTGDIPIVYYVTENLAGRKASITTDLERGGSNVPVGEAIYFDLSDDTSDRSGYVSYKFYLGDGTPQDFNVVRHHQYNVHVTLRGASSATDKRVELHTANCYIVSSDNAKCSFHATVMGNGATTPDGGLNAPEILPAALRPASVKVLWEQKDPAVGGATVEGDVIKLNSVGTDGTYITFTTGIQKGNAVIGAFDDAGTLIWSWHIWHTDINPYNIPNVECHTTANGGRDFKMMDRNLGAFNNSVNNVGAYGLLYQWGRKDPFPGATSVDQADQTVAAFEGVVTENGYNFAAVQALTGVTVQGGVQTPMNFYYNNSGNKDWVTTQNDNLWGNPYTNSSVSPNPDLGSKSIYDPCPYGYRVPPQDMWSQVTAANSTWATNGWQVGVGIGGTPAKYFYPAAGVREGDRVGQLSGVGGYGSYWSSSPVSIGGEEGGNISFDPGFVYPNSNGKRVYGMSVRCMKEE